jgi:hypothetical protein
MRKTAVKAGPRTKSAKPAARKKSQAPKRAAAAPDHPPLAEPLDELARVAPALIESLRSLPDALAPVERATQALGEIARGLEHAQTRLQEVTFHLPRPSEYEPLAEPLRDFARLSPALVGSLEAAPRLADALVAATLRIEAAVEHIGTQPTPVAPAPAAEAPLSPGLLALRLSRIAHAIGSARDAIRDALRSLPPAERYAPVARQLKELASVSPSLMEWMREVPRLTTPLAGCVDALNAAAEELDGACVDVAITQRDLNAVETAN